MEQLTPEGLKVVNELAQHYGFSQEAVIHMMFAMLRGQGGMAQFNHPEFAGSGQWMRGGMLMLADMFNHSLNARLEGLCQAIAGKLASQPELFPTGSFQSQNQSGGGQQMQVGGSLFTPDPRDSWWPKELGTPSAIGAQNDVRYALFPAVGRLAVEANGQVSVYDTGHHNIAGFSQQQSPGGAVVFSTPGGSVNLASLTSLAGGFDQQAQSSGGGSQQQQQVNTGMAPMGGMSPMGSMGGMAPMSFTPMATTEPWWPQELGTPTSTGAQNDLRYAVFPAARRLVVELNGRMSVHDIGNLQIHGCSQASGEEGGARFTTNDGPIPLASLPEVQPAATASTEASAQESRTEDVLDALTRLGELKAKGILTEAEFSAKKTELLRRL
ncbi:MAG: SHOCT domain-containing protein [Cyanobacteriota bacterium]